MSWKGIHRWLGLTVGTLAVVLGVSGAILAIDPVQQAWQAPVAPGDLPMATLVERVTRTVPGAEEIRHLPSGAVAVFSFAGDQPQARYVDPSNGRILGDWQASALPRWVKNLHRSLLLGDAGRWGAAGIALAMALLCVSALVLLLRRMGGWRQLAARVRGSAAQRIHVVAGRVVLLVLFMSSITALTMSASTLGLVALDAGTEPEVLSVVASQPALPGAQLAALQTLVLQDLRKLNFPDATDPEDTWKVATTQGQGWIDRYSGQMLAWQDATLAQRVYDWAVVLHTGEAAWAWAVVLGLVGASVLLFWLSGVVIWWQARRAAPNITGNAPMAQADVLIFVASEGGSTWGFAQTLQDALSQGGLPTMEIVFIRYAAQFLIVSAIFFPQRRMALTNDALYLHCLPADIGAEVSPGVMDRFRVDVAREANKKVYVIMALLAVAKVSNLAAVLKGGK